MSNIQKTIYKNLLLPGNDLISGTQISKLLRFLETSQWYTKDELEVFQRKKLRALIDHSYRNVPYYHKLFKNLNIKPSDISSIKDLRKLPILTKDEMIRQKEDFLSIDHKTRHIIRDSTSGSSGKPFIFIIDKETLSMSRAMGLRSWGFAGYNPGDKLVTVAGSALLPHKMKLMNKITYIANRNMPLSSYNMNKEKVNNYLGKIKKFKPKFIRGYPSSLINLSRYLVENNDRGIVLDAVMTTAEKLYSQDRKIIGQAFDCDVFDQCGCNDGGESLHECQNHMGYHVGMERAIHEFVDESGEMVSDGEKGHIISTDLWNFSMPFIRYDAGDIAVPIDEACTCGRGLSIVKTIIGRTVDQIVLPGGMLFPAHPLMDVFGRENADKILEYQIIQEKIDKFIINIVKNESYGEETTKEIANFFEAHIGIPLEIDFNFVEKISRSSADKRIIIKSNVR
jgi:phenylacetate-CoA ligase